MIRLDGPDGSRFLNPGHVVSVCDSTEGAVLSLSNGDRLTVAGLTAAQLMERLGAAKPQGVVAHPAGVIPNLRLKGER